MTSASTKRRHKRNADAFRPWDARAARAENEIQRLRAAMVHAMQECETMAGETKSLPLKHGIMIVAENLKAALDKK